MHSITSFRLAIVPQFTAPACWSDTLVSKCQTGSKSEPKQHLHSLSNRESTSGLHQTGTTREQAEDQRGEQQGVLIRSETSESIQPLTMFWYEPLVFKPDVK